MSPKTTLKTGTYHLNKVSKVDLEANKRLETLLLVCFILGLIKQVLLYNIHSVGHEVWFDIANIPLTTLLLILIVLLLIAFILALIREFKDPLNRNFTISLLLFSSLILLNFNNTYSLIKNLIGLEVTILDRILFFTAFSGGVICLGLALFVALMRRFKRAEPSTTTDLLKVTNMALAVSLIGMIVLVGNSLAIMFAGNISPSAQQLDWADPSGLIQFLIIVSAGIILALVLWVFPKTRIHYRHHPDNIWEKLRRRIRYR